MSTSSSAALRVRNATAGIQALQLLSASLPAEEDDPVEHETLQSPDRQISKHATEKLELGRVRQVFFVAPLASSARGFQERVLLQLQA